MAGIHLERGKKIYAFGQPMTALHLITSGRIRVSFPGGQYDLVKGDVVGVVELCSEVHYLEYSAAEESVILTYPFSSIDSLADQFRRHPDVARLFLLSAFQQISIVLNQYVLTESNCSNLFQDLKEDYERYQQFCHLHRIPTRTLGALEVFSPFLSESEPDLWVYDYYLGLTHLYSGELYKPLVEESAVNLGLLRKCSLDYRKLYNSFSELNQYQDQIAGFYFQESGNDLFDLYTALYYRTNNSPEESSELFSAINRMLLEFQDSPAAEPEVVQKRIDSFRRNLHLLQAKEDAITTNENTEILSELAGSLHKILDFAGSDLDLADSFRGHIHSYLTLSNRTSMDEEVCQLRTLLTEEFYMLYSIIFRQSIEASYLPIPIRMFLYFGYVDEELAGPTNAVCLYQAAQTMAEHTGDGIYTFYDWLLAIYHGQREPSRNEFEQDYNDYLRKQKLGGTITDTEYQELKNNAFAKVSYELRNLFPQLNRMTFGRGASFCPVFSSENVMKDLKSCQVTSLKLSKALDHIRKVDYSAFYRSSLDIEHADTMGKEIIHLEYLPDIILMPNVGLRGIMWQEIEGKMRNTPGRMILSIFHLEDVSATFLRMTGEFRWELCKRIQGNRWNDVSSHSLTSEYYDYIQFYRKNHELSPEAKERLHTNLQRTKNNFREMFIRDYIIWILSEGTGSPRLNKVARRIFFNHCPFSAAVCEKLHNNPLYIDLLLQRKAQIKQRLHHLDNLQRKLETEKLPVPDTLLQEKKYTEGNVS